MSIEPPPISDLLAEQNGLPRIPWIMFFNNIFEGDGGNEWSPTFTALGTTGTPTITGRYYRINQRTCLFFVTIVPGTNTSSVAGTTYINNFPLTFSTNSVCFAVTGTGAVQAIGGINAGNNGIYTPVWTNSTATLTVVGFGIVT